ncbi:hypothetical protein [Acidocella aquatica]|nr:hypothetical protein [Acidocella aquatica]
MRIIGKAENIILQHKGIRSTHGWLESVDQCRYICFFGDSDSYLFKILYDFQRPDVANLQYLGRGFLAEIVYGAEKIKSRLSPPKEQDIGLVLNADFATIGLIECGASVMSSIQKISAGKK